MSPGMISSTYETRNQTKLVSMKDLMAERYPRGIPTPSCRFSLKKRYEKLKEPLFDPEGSRMIYWREVPLHGHEDADGHYESLVGFFDLVLVRSVRRIMDKMFGKLFGSPKFEECVCGCWRV